MSPERIARCRRTRIAPTVQVQRRTDGGIALQGIHRCASVWSCPVCSQRICSGRAEEVKAAAEAWELAGGRLELVTLTVRHGLGDDLGTMRRGVADAWRLLNQGRGAGERRERWGLRFYVRALEVTHGPSGWHPHLHVLMFTADGEVDRRELAEQWQESVARALGSEHRPSLERGVHVDSVDARAGGYLAKLGLEVGNPIAKGAKLGNRTAWQIAVDAAEGDVDAGDLWRIYTRGIHGARQLTWSRGARQAFGLERLRDEQVLERQEHDGEGELVAEWTASAWDFGCRRSRYWVSGVISRALEGVPLERLTPAPVDTNSRGRTFGPLPRAVEPLAHIALNRLAKVLPTGTARALRQLAESGKWPCRAPPLDTAPARGSPGLA